ncbi:MAG: prepilin-type N-terminal cleavage/methylation domain-containing protein, partial [Planctomycetes bacterium]|nr:prepilin-type N-terminal cleavage/methylation domain-containing protein [Planctomycetota bacterium]
MKPLKNVRFCSSSRKVVIATAGINSVFRGLKFEPNDEIGEIGQKGALCKGLMRPSGQKGFTIIELAIVLVIIGLIVGFGASLVGPLTIRAKRTESREILKAAKESIVGFAAANGRIPIWGDNISDTIAVDEFCEVVTNRRDAFTQPLYYFPADANNQLQTAGTIC